MATKVSKLSTSLIRFMATSTIALGLLPNIAHAGDRAPVNCDSSMQYGSSQGIPPHYKALGLSPEQQEKMRAISAAHQEVMQKNLRLMSDNQQAERALVEAPVFDENKAQHLVDSDAKIMRESNLATLQFRHQIYQILTPEQREKFNKMRAQHPEMRQRMRAN